MTFIHVADIHASKERKEQTLQILHKLNSYVTLNPVDFIVFAGDFWDSTITNTKSSGFSDIIKSVSDLNHKCQLFMIYGTPSHEPEGSLDLFFRLGINIYHQILFADFENYDILFIPEPRRSNFISQSQEETNSKINEYLDLIKQYHKNDTKPFIVVYHGEVKGAHYQNGIGVNSPIALSKELLQSTHADYYACGHIHEPQEVFKNCFYSGSAAPIDFGETHDAGFNVVTIDEKGTNVERISFGFPINTTLELDNKNIETIMSKDFSNRNLKLKLECSEKINVRDIEKKIVESTNAVSCKIIPHYPDVTNIRAKEIMEQRSVMDELSVYASVNGITLSKSALNKAQNLEDSMLIKYAFPKHEFKLLYASVKGAIGLSVPEFNVDFTTYSPGLIVMVGKNGAGKSTFLENLHPFPCMLTRSGKLRDHFYDKDSHRILIYQDENGLKYRITIQMAANIKSGITKYFVETDDGSGWKPVSECDGNLESYNRYIEETFGSLSIFLRTSFFTDSNISGYPDIAHATKGERLELFSKLAGTDYYSTLCQFAKDASKDIDANIKAAESLIYKKGFYEENLSKYSESLKENQKELDEYNKEMVELKAKLKDLQKQDIEYQKYLAKKESLRLLAEQYQKQIDDNIKTIDVIKSDKVLSEKISNHADDIQLYKDLVKKNEAYQETINSKYTDLDKKNKELDSENKVLNSLTAEISNLSIEASKIKADIEYGELNLVDHDESTCPTCGAKLSSEKAAVINAKYHETKKHIEDSRGKLKDINLNIVDKTNSQDVSQKKVNDIQNDIKAISDSIAQIKGYVKLDNDSLAKLADVKDILDTKAKFTYHDSNIAKLESINKELNMKIHGQVAGDVVKDVSFELQDTDRVIDVCSKNIQNYTSAVNFYTTEIATSQTMLNDIEETEKKIKTMEKDKSDYSIFVNAFANTGIPALKLEAVIPSVIKVANDILHSSYGDKFTINFSSQHQGSTKVIEDFNITAFNSEKNVEETLDLVSAGELVWLKQAIYYAFGVVRQTNTGSGFITRFMDESDGHLDSDMRTKYVGMINAAHTAGNAYQTILVTHSQEIKDIAEQVIEL